ncbi:ribonuclease T2 family protein [Zavarzinia sp. CC-PAN008]|uniref:ribonuclease T2 family protein n=1 Tax=Zavarzinia sp. CC-PAN008 TaxID=3243332 RepID=UPI003F74AACB
MRRLAWAIALSLLPFAAGAEVQRDGTFLAERTCPAPRAIRDGANPGQVQVRAGQAYALRGQNRDRPTHYLVEVPGAEPTRRWVEVECGRLAENAEAAPLPRPTTSEDYVLAVTWHPAFCETKPGLPECAALDGADFAASHFVLHGLWPQDAEYCGVPAGQERLSRDRAWQRLPPLDLPADVQRDLAQAMPGSRSALDRHEWVKHGTCSGLAPGAYYRVSLALLRQLNAATPRDLFEDSLGERLRAEQIRGAFDQAFGAGAGQRVTVECSDGPDRLIVELRIALAGPLGPDSSLGPLIRAGKTRPRGCPVGRVDGAD